ncbi:MAG: cyclic 2,3-diphosphoglycerate synthase [Anaerolineaceae bacterium]|nr:cyclic 2,3-diphosphoglycerate synthase [Anaerolineaceae bacterium]
MSRIRTIIMGAAGRDFHNFNTVYRDNDKYEVVAFTATQIPNIDGRKYPSALAGHLYPEGIEIYPESELEELIKKFDVDEVVFAYSDVPYEYVMSKSALVNAAGADFRLLGTKETQVESNKPLIGVTAIRTGAGKSQTSRRVAEALQNLGYKVAAIRHPMPYGDLVKQKVQRFATYEDLDIHECTIEEREEYEPHIDTGVIIYSGVDYEAILRDAEKEADVILWDGGNNDFSFYKTDLLIVVMDPHRAGHELRYYPAEVNMRMADVFVINKVDTAKPSDIDIVRESIARVNPDATVVEAASPIFVENPEMIKGKRVLAIDEGPTVTHGDLPYDFGYFAAKRYGAKEIVDPRPFAVGDLKETFKKFPHLGNVLPSMGYGEKQIRDLEATIDGSDVDLVVIGTPIDMTRVMKINKPSVRVTYKLQEIGSPTLQDVIENKLGRKE